MKADEAFGGHADTVSYAPRGQGGVAVRILQPPPSDLCIAAELAKRGTPIGAVDTLVAAQALSLGLTVVTNDTRRFGRVPGLKLENWLWGGAAEQGD